MTLPRSYFLLILLACAGALGVALTAEHVFGLEPCILCLYERIPYAIAGVAGLAMVALPTSPNLRRLAFILIVLAFTANAGLSIYHVGVEQAWWASPACQGGSPATMSLDSMKQALSGPLPPACDDVQWSLFGISFAGYNLLFSVALVLFSLLVARGGFGASRITTTEGHS